MSAPKTDALPTWRRPISLRSKGFTGDLTTCSVTGNVHFAPGQTGLHLATSGLALGVFVTGIAAACRPEPLGPEQTLTRFLADVRYGKAQSAFAALCEDTQTALRDRHEQLDANGHDRSTPEGRILFRELGLEVLHAPESVNVASPIGDTVTLRVTVQRGDSANVYLERTGDRWCVDLNRTLQTIPADPNTGAPGPARAGGARK